MAVVEEINGQLPTDADEQESIAFAGGCIVMSGHFEPVFPSFLQGAISDSEFAEALATINKALDEGTGSFPETSRGFWRVAFKYKGRFTSVGSGYPDEEAAALAHDDYVREHQLRRRLHFPRPGEEGAS